MATTQNERLEKAAYTPSSMAALSDALYERLRARLARKKDLMLLDTLVMVFCYRVRAAQGRGQVPREMNAALQDVVKG